jgi:large subunit ribosomal protein L43|uniref:Large ribosomal subunit protein mL43 n=1 Tax=Attheya septentrionalis TaxID=420275 RepID=A0A7S2UTM3_9STRA|mmetsp:Transcript_8996/g.16381  ORF Transcript_8996/g.16381 Transcript_8996/m.16381 type:complete len:138 (+) Transcript_8996:295-708(+)|eukprot:CAMPEP_0198292404 /NCGR_PEP_ID=MMETSP1449-20131203/11976_1 /TAXON_ID=420275 /ORGANISM="Attheya septentrionalis, Strain CCMP2084" /LENGTH=137 /DNA_ID=CAMNT_0043991419 /DNA_START=268 /DNA_END=681 /DNA_ORIENTATION=+
MATRGVKQLEKLRFLYCEHGGSSRAVREYISSGKVVDFCNANPSVTVIVQPRNGNHPFVKAEYMTGFDKHIGVKNVELKRVEQVVAMLNNSSGRKIKKIGNPIRTDTPSIQGIWTPMLHLKDTSFPIEIVESQSSKN